MGDIGASGEPGANGEWHIADLNRLRRFLCLGDETGCCKVEPDKEKHKKKQTEQMVKENAESILSLIEGGQGLKVVEEIVKFTEEGRCTKPKPALFSLAICAHLSKDLKTVQAAYRAIPGVCKIPTQLFTFVKFSEKLKAEATGWGSGQRRAISKWYNGKDPLQLAMYVTKYIQRNGWSHVDVLRLAHVKPKDDATAAVLMYVTKGFEKAKLRYEKDDASEETKKVFKFLAAVNSLKHTKDEQEAAGLISEHKLVKEHAPTWFSGSAEVWRALIPQMPLTSLMKSLGKLATLKLLDPMVANTCAPLVIERIKDQEAFKSAKIHPFTILVAIKSYESGKSSKSKNKWPCNGAIIDALNETFYASFDNVVSTGKRFLLALDVSKSMKYGGVNGSSVVNPATATAAMAMATARSEKDYKMLAFSKTVVEISLNPTMKLHHIAKEISTIPVVGGADCCKPIKWALEKKEKFDVFVVYTDCETWPSTEKPVDVLRMYRKEMGIPEAKLVVCALTSQTITVADKTDNGMLDVAGFDSMTPNIISSFVRGEL